MALAVPVRGTTVTCTYGKRSFSSPNLRDANRRGYTNLWEDAHTEARQQRLNRLLIRLMKAKLAIKFDRLLFNQSIGIRAEDTFTNSDSIVSLKSPLVPRLRRLASQHTRSRSICFCAGLVGRCQRRLLGRHAISAVQNSRVF